MFPLSITHIKKVHLESKEEPEIALKVIANELERLLVDKIEIYNNRLTFKNSMFNGQGRNHIMTPVDSGYFELNVELQYLKYHYSMKRMFFEILVMTLIIGSLAYSETHLYWIGVYLFSGLFGLNWITAIIRHKSFFNKIIKSLNGITSHNNT